MAPKATDGVSADTASFQFILAVLKHNKSTLEPSWDDVAKECGISYGRNANTKFKDLMKKLGYRVDAGKLVPINNSTPAVVATPKKGVQANGKKAKTPASNKKRRLTPEEEEEEEEEEEVIERQKDEEGGNPEE